MQSGPCESMFLMVKKYLLLYFRSLFSNRISPKKEHSGFQIFFFYINTRGTLKYGQTRFLGPFHWTHIAFQAAV
jgi:hypothetical protein